MTVTSVKRIGDGQGGSHRGPHESSITLTYRVITDNPLDTPSEIRGSMPYQWGDPLGSTGLICRGEDYDFQNKGPSQSVWHVGLEFESTQIDQEEQERKDIPDPLERRARVTVRSVRYGELTDRDKNGNIKRTSAGEIYEPKEKDKSRWTISVRKNYTSIPDFIWTYQDKLNAASVTVKGRVLAAETVKFGEVNVPELVIENGVEHYPIEFQLDYRREGWVDKRVDAGFIYLNAGVPTKIMIVDDDGNDIETPIARWLDGAGGIVANPADGDEIINEWDDYETADFSILPLNEG
jgi:hypothetical protein